MHIRFSFFKMKIQGILIVPADMHPHMETGHGPGCRTWPGMQDMKPGMEMCPEMKQKRERGHVIT